MRSRRTRAEEREYSVGFSPIQSDGLPAIAAEAGSTPMRLARASLLHRSPNILLIPGTSSVAHLRQNLAAGDIMLDDDLCARLDALGERAAS